MNFNRLFSIATVILLSAAGAFAQQRPLLTEDPRVIADGAVVSELGFGYQHEARFPVSGLTGNLYSVLVNGLHFGFGDRAEFQMTGVAHSYLRVEGGGSRNDWGDFAMSTKIRLVDEARFRPIVTFRPTVVLPNTSSTRGIGTDGTHFFGSLLFGKGIGPAFVFGNLGLGILDDAVRAQAQQDVLTYGIAASIPAGSRMNVVSEWSGYHNPQENPSPGGESRGQVRLGVQVRAKGFRWDAAATAGTTRLDHNAGFVVGMTREFQLW